MWCGESVRGCGCGVAEDEQRTQAKGAPFVVCALSDSTLAVSLAVGVSLHLVSRPVSRGHPSFLGAYSLLSHWGRKEMGIQ